MVWFHLERHAPMSTCLVQDHVLLSAFRRCLALRRACACDGYQRSWCADLSSTSKGSKSLACSSFQSVPSSHRFSCLLGGEEFHAAGIGGAKFSGHLICRRASSSSSSGHPIYRRATFRSSSGHPVIRKAVSNVWAKEGRKPRLGGTDSYRHPGFGRVSHSRSSGLPSYPRGSYSAWEEEGRGHESSIEASGQPFRRAASSDWREDGYDLSLGRITSSKYCSSSGNSTSTPTSSSSSGWAEEHRGTIIGLSKSKNFNSPNASASGSVMKDRKSERRWSAENGRSFRTKKMAGDTTAYTLEAGDSKASLAESARRQMGRNSRVSGPQVKDGYDHERGGGFIGDWRWQSRERVTSSRIELEGQCIYGVGPILCALQASRRTFYSLYMQENLLENVDRGKRKDKSAVSFMKKTAADLGLTVKTASKHDLNMLVDNRPHQGVVLDASPLELVPVAMLDPPHYEEGKSPVWVALDEVTDPQNFGAILRSAYFLGAEGVVVCAKNSAPLSGVVSKASAGALEIMEVLFCRNMVKFLDSSRENGWRVLGASAELNSVPVRGITRGIATILVLGNEGKGLRTNVRRACDQLVSIAAFSNGCLPSKIDSTQYDIQEDSEEVGPGLGNEDDGEPIGRRGAEAGFMAGPMAVDSLNVSVATGIMLYELLSSQAENGTVSSVLPA